MFLCIPKPMDEVFTGQCFPWINRIPPAEPTTHAIEATDAATVRSPEQKLLLRREQWLRAATTITRHLLVGIGVDSLQVIAHTAREVAGAKFVTVALPTHDGRHVMVEVAVGAEELVGTTYGIEGSLAGRAIRTGQAVVHRATDSEAPPEWTHLPAAQNIGAVIAVPLLGLDGVRGCLGIVRPADSDDFVAVDIEMAMVFANHASLALELADGREQRYRVEILEDRARLAGDLHDHVIQRLFAAALRLDVAGEEITDEDVGAEVSSVVASIRETIGQLRNTITGLRSQPVAMHMTTMRRRIERVVDEFAVLLPRTARLRIDGPLERVTDGTLADDVVAVVREMLSNAGRHAYASRVDLAVVTTDDGITVEVVDDGVGIGEPDRRSGLDSLRRRAVRNGGTFTLDVDHPGRARPGTRAVWTGRIAKW
jgi:signal transduction histidine kinase